MAWQAVWGGADDGHVLNEKLWLSAGLVQCERCRISLWGSSRPDQTCSPPAPELVPYLDAIDEYIGEISEQSGVPIIP